MLYRIYKHLNNELKQKSRFIWFMFFAKGCNSSSNALIITSETRGGSTWLAELIVSHLPAALVWEPFHPVKGVLKKQKYNYGHRPFVDPAVTDNELKSVMEDILSGNKFTHWTTKKNSLLQIKNAQYLLVKFVRANRLLPWVFKNLMFNYKPILLIRHPIAVALSQINTFKGLKNKPAIFVVPQVKNNDIYLKNEHYLNSLSSLLEQKVALWCINNIHTLSNPDVRNKTIRVYYEHLLLNPENELNKIFNEWNFKTTIKQDILRKESSTTGKQGLPEDIMLQLNKWQHSIDTDTLKRLQTVFDHFAFKLYNVNDGLPLIDSHQ